MLKDKLFGASALALLTWGAAAGAAETASPDIIVTATKRDQSLQSVPISVSVTGAETIQKAQIVDLIDLQSVVPSLKVSQLNATGQTTFSVRGFSDGFGNLGLENAVGLFIDGVYRSRSASSLSDLPEVERIEVLRGPQSTLFGKNVSIGAISITTKRPEFRWGGVAEATIGNYGDVQARASLNAPLGDQVALRLSGSVDQRDGYFSDISTGGNVNNRDRWQVRGDLLFKPSADLSVRIIADYNKIKEVCCGVTNIYTGLRTKFIAAPAPNGLGKLISTPAGIESHQVAYNYDPTNNLVGQGISGQIDWNLGFGKLTSITAYRDQTNDSVQDVDFTAADLAKNVQMQRTKTFTQEIRLASTGHGPISWLIGGFYSDEKATTRRNITYGADTRGYINGLTGGASSLVSALELLQYSVQAQGALLGGPAPTIIPGKTYFQPGQGISDNWDLKDRSYSVFGQADWKITPQLTLTGGLAYANDHKSVTSNVTLNDPFSALNLNNVPLLGALPFAALPASLAGCLLQKGFNPASTGGKVPVNLFGSSLGTSLPGPGSAPCPASPGGVNPFSLSSLPPFNNLIAISPAAYNLPNATESGILNGGKITYNARIAYEIQHNLNVYASYSTGWKAGSYNLSSDSTPATAAGVGRSARPENVEVYEVGLKAKFRNGYVNIALFDEVAKDFQTNTFIGTGYALLNAEKETIKGVEFDASYAPVKPLLLGFNLTYLDPKYNKYSQAGCFYYDTVRCPLDAQGNLPIFRDLSGTRPGGVPTWSITASALYTQDLGHGFSGYIRGEYDYSSRTTIGDGVPSTGAAATFGTYLVSQINGSIGLQTPFKLDVNLWVRNLTNQIYLISAFPTVLQSATPSSGDFIGSFSGYPSAPRTWGLTIRKAF